MVSQCRLLSSPEGQQNQAPRVREAEILAWQKAAGWVTKEDCASVTEPDLTALKDLAGQSADCRPEHERGGIQSRFFMLTLAELSP